MIDRLRGLVQEDFAAVNTLILEKIQSDIGLVDQLAHHIIESGGKRLRPLLVLLASHACQYQGKVHVDAAVMMEFFHTATLLHDDVVDESPLRRGRKTANQIFGSKASILGGDYLLTQSLQLMMNTQSWSICNLLVETAFQISSGELQQLSNRHNYQLSKDTYFEIIRTKTALLFAASATIGPILAQSGKAVEDALFSYGLHLGNAFQLMDDLLDYVGDESLMGKEVGHDLADSKVTFPLLYAMERSSEEEKILLQESIESGSTAHFETLLDIIKRRGGIEATREKAQSEAKAAIAALEMMPASIYKEGLVELAIFSSAREY